MLRHAEVAKWGASTHGRGLMAHEVVSELVNQGTYKFPANPNTRPLQGPPRRLRTALQRVKGEVLWPACSDASHRLRGERISAFGGRRGETGPSQEPSGRVRRPSSVVVIQYAPRLVEQCPPGVAGRCDKLSRSSLLPRFSASAGEGEGGTKLDVNATRVVYPCLRESACGKVIPVATRFQIVLWKVDGKYEGICSGVCCRNLSIADTAFGRKGTGFS
jgi:hypothetical protein